MHGIVWHNMARLRAREIGEEMYCYGCACRKDTKKDRENPLPIGG